MLEIRLAEAQRRDRASASATIFSRALPDPAARCCRRSSPTRAVPPVLLIDELDRADEPFEAFLLEVLSDFQVTIPGARHDARRRSRRSSCITSNRTREIHDAVKRRCLYHWVDYPDAARELQILQRRVPGRRRDAGARDRRLRAAAARRSELFKLPGVAETIDWARALIALDALVLDPATINDTLGVLLKYQDDIARLQAVRRGAIAAKSAQRGGAAARSAGVGGNVRGATGGARCQRLRARQGRRSARDLCRRA